MYQIVIAGQRLEIDWPTYAFDDAGHGLDAYQSAEAPTHPAKLREGQTSRYRLRHLGERTLKAVQAKIRQLVVHLDGCAGAKMCFDVLHRERGLSCHLILDNDGTLYQTLDLADCAYHAAGLNETSIGIEICNRGDARPDPHYYDHPGMLKRDIVTCNINGHEYRAFDFTRPQYEAMAVLGRFLARHLPGIKLDFPQSAPGAQHWGTLVPGGPALANSYSGWLGHYHITEQKWDPGPFDFKKHLSKLTGKRSFPVGLHGQAAELPDAPAEGDAERPAYARLFDPYYASDEEKGSAFPVGPLDGHPLYHGGIHLHAPRGAPVVAPVAGKIVLARNRGTELGIGSTSFVLLEHNLKVGKEQLVFYTLLMHLLEEGKGGDRPRWMTGRGWRLAEPFGVLAPTDTVRAGEVVGHVGTAGPDGEPQIHWEVFTLDHGAVAALDRTGFWKEYSGARDQRFCSNAEILRKIKGDDHEWARSAVTSHYSEWAEDPSWKGAILEALGPGIGARRRREIDEMVEEQILPTIWWRDDVAELLGLPREARVYTYHPVSFLRWLNDLVGARQSGQIIAPTLGGPAMLDIDDVDGTSMFAAADDPPPRPGIDLQQMLDGYGD